MRKKLSLSLASLVTAAGLALAAPALAGATVPAPPSPPTGTPICATVGSAISGNYANLTVTGNEYVANKTTLTVTGNLVIAPGGCLDAVTLGTVTVGGNVLVGRGAILGLGCDPNALGPVPPCNNDTTNDTVGKDIIADGALTMYLDADTVHGSVVSNGGGPGATLSPYVNFAIKDNKISGDLIVHGWQGAWFGALRNVVGGNVVVTDNVGLTKAENGALDSTEIVTNTVTGDLICLDNSPPAQFGDSGGTANVVSGQKIGECEHL